MLLFDPHYYEAFIQKVLPGKPNPESLTRVARVNPGGRYVKVNISAARVNLASSLCTK